MPRSAPRPSDLELQILGVLWRRGPSTAREVLTAIPDGKKRAYTSVLSVMQVMHQKGLLALAPKKRKLANVYRPAFSRRAVLGPIMRNLVQRVFAGRPAQAVQHLLNESDITDEELTEIRQLLDEMEARRE